MKTKLILLLLGNEVVFALRHGLGHAEKLAFCELQRSRNAVEFEGKKPPADCEKGGHDPAKSKAELIKYLKDSFDYSNRVIASLTADNALDRIEGRYAGPNTKLGISVTSVWHVTDHYGQLVEYLRMNRIVPPMTQKYGVKVR